MKLINVFVLLVVVSSSAYCDEIFNLKLSASTLIIMDGLTTYNLGKHPTTYETNLILGRHPTNSDLAAYFSICAASVWLVKHLPYKYQKPVLYYVNSLQSSVVTFNMHSIGVGVSF